MKAKRTVCAVLAAFFLAAAFLFPGCAEGNKGVPDALRLHVIANSDSVEDQAAKVKVRDAILEEFNGGFGASTKEEAEETLLSMGERLQKAADRALNNSGMDYGAELVFGEFEFPDRTYGDRLYPAGEYTALRVILGEGKGRNWWCVMFPPLCVIETEPGETQVNEDGTLRFRSFFLELWRGLFGK